MSQSPHVMHLRNGTKMGNDKLTETMVNGGLWDAFNGYHMGATVENIAEQFQITQNEQDVFAVASQNKAVSAMKEGRFKDKTSPSPSKHARVTLSLTWMNTQKSVSLQKALANCVLHFPRKAWSW